MTKDLDLPRPFEEGASLRLGGLTVETAADRMSLYGSLDVTRDRRGLHDAKRLRALLDAAVKEMEADKGLPDRVPELPGDTVGNPFA